VAQFFKKLFFPKAWLLALASAAGAAALFGVFYYGQSEQLLIAVPVYAFCTWVLCCVCVRAPRIYRATVRFLKKNRFLRRMMEDREYAATVGILFSFEMDLFYCIFKAVSAFAYRSAFSGAVAFYHLVMGSGRFMLLRGLRRAHDDMEKELREFRFCGHMLLWLTAAITAMNLYSVLEGQQKSYPGLTIYAAATYTFFSLYSALHGIIRFHRAGDPLCTAGKCMSLGSALVSLLSLEEAMSIAFGDGGSWQRVMQAATGFGVFLIVAALSAFMVRRANRQLRELRQ